MDTVTMVVLAATRKAPVIRYARVVYHIMVQSVPTSAARALSTAPKAALVQHATVKTDGKEDFAKQSAAAVRTGEPAYPRLKTLAVSVPLATVDTSAKYTSDVI